nr:hypothetical protein [Mycolicibacterium malmesburyense]
MKVDDQPVRFGEDRGARIAHLVAAERHRLAAEAHERAARVHRHAAAEGIGDVATHLSAVAVYEAARDADLRACEVALRMAREEQNRSDHNVARP